METVIQIRVLFVAGSEQFFVEAAPGSLHGAFATFDMNWVLKNMDLKDFI